MKVKNIVYEQNGNISKGIENLKEILEMKSAITEVEKFTRVFKGRFEKRRIKKL